MHIDEHTLKRTMSWVKQAATALKPATDKERDKARRTRTEGTDRYIKTITGPTNWTATHGGTGTWSSEKNGTISKGTLGRTRTGTVAAIKNDSIVEKKHRNKA